MALAILFALQFENAAFASQVSSSGVVIVDTQASQIANSATFVLETRPWDGASDSANSGSFRLDTRSGNAIGLVVSGPATLGGGQSAAYTATAVYLDGTYEDVTGKVTWDLFAAPAGSGMSGAVFKPGGTDANQTATIIARFMRHTGAVLGSKQVTVTPGIVVSMLYPETHFLSGSGNNVTYQFMRTAAAVGAVPPLSVTWTWKGNAIPGQNTLSLNAPITGPAGFGMLGVSVTDSHGRSDSTSMRVLVNKAPNLAQGVQRLTAGDYTEGDWLDKDGEDFVFDPAKAPNGLIVLTHGLVMDGETASQQIDWLKAMAQTIQIRLMADGKPLPNILIYDWTEDAATIDGLSYEDRKEEALRQVAGFPNAPLRVFVQTAAFLDGEPGLRAGLGQLWGVIASRPAGLQHGQFLASSLKRRINQGQIAAGAPVHFIGHSAGGFVVGECAKRLDSFISGQTMVTMLDTPHPYAAHFSTRSSTHQMERYKSSVASAGWLAPELETEAGYHVGYSGVSGSTPAYQIAIPIVPPDANYHLSDINPSAGLFSDFIGLLNLVNDHTLSRVWYYGSIGVQGDAEQNGFFRSPFVSGSSGGISSSNFIFAADPNFDMESDDNGGASGPSTSTWMTFGSVTQIGDVYTLTEANDAGIQQEYTVPLNADTLSFTFQFITPGDGDYLVVDFGDGLPVYLGADDTISREAPLLAEIPLGAYRGQAARLAITLRSRGNANAVVVLDNFSLTTTEDPDVDGLTIAQEQTVGTNPLLYDSDGDGLSDTAEIQTHLTNPLSLDTDDDGANDSAELTAGTSPTNGQSFFRVTDAVKNTNGTMLLRWPSQAGRFYNVQRSTDMTFATYEVISQEITATPPLNTHVDNSAGASPDGRYFYRIEVYQP